MECVGSRNLGVYRVLKGDYRFVELYRKKLSALMKGTWTKLFPILLNSVFILPFQFFFIFSLQN